VSTVPIGYFLNSEAYFHDALGEDDKLSIDVHPVEGYDGESWEFYAHMVDIDSSPCLELEFYHDSVQAFADRPDLFVAIAAAKPNTLDEFRAVLDSVGARDVTTRTRPTS
jgi:hypothetical protein